MARLAQTVGFALAWVTARPAMADSPERTVAGNAGAAVAAYAVEPLEAVLLFDLWFWDDNLPDGTGVGNYVEFGDKRWLIQDFSDDGYVYRPVSEVERATVVPRLAEALTREVGKVRLHISLEGGDLVAKPTVEPYDPVALGVPFDQAATDKRIRMVTGVSAVPVVVDVATGALVGFVPSAPNDTYGVHDPPTEVDKIRVRAILPPDTLPLAAGMLAVTGGRNVEIASIEGNRVEVLEEETFVDATPRANPDQVSVPALPTMSLLGALYFTLRFGLPNLLGVPAALRTLRQAVGSRSALAMGLSATMGLGTMTGVAVAIAVGGPGALPWMLAAAFLGMASRFAEVTLAGTYAEDNDDGGTGGPMHSIDRGLEDLGLSSLGKGLAFAFALFCIAASLGAGSLSVVHQTSEALGRMVPVVGAAPWAVGLAIMTVAGGLLFAGEERTRRVTAVVLPVAAFTYLAGAGGVLVAHAGALGGALGTILSGATSGGAAMGGVVGAAIAGMSRAVLASQIGFGGSAIAHTPFAARDPAAQGRVAMLEPLVDTALWGGVTGLVLVVVGGDPTGSAVEALTRAFGAAHGALPVLLGASLLGFALVNVLAWGTFGSRCATWLVGTGGRIPFLLLFALCGAAGAWGGASTLVRLSHALLLCMALPNLIGTVLLSGRIADATRGR